MSGYESWASSPAARATMKGNKRRDTAPEMAVRRLVHAAGLRYRVDAKPLPGLNRRADLVFTRAKVAVFVDGCFWHACPQHATWPARNKEWWRAKLKANTARDRDTDAALVDAGWLVIRVWEHETPEDAANRVANAVSSRRGESCEEGGDP